MPNSLQSSAIASPASRRATNCSLSSITEHSFQGITPSPLRGESVTYVSGTMCYLCLRPLITSKYAAILTFPLFGDLPQETVLSTVCQLYDLPDSNTLRGVKTLQVKAEQLASIWLCRECRPVRSKDVQGSARHCKACGRSEKAFLVGFRGDSSAG